MISTRFTATEWLTGNMHRAYPLDESTAGVCPIPPALLADLFILVSGAEDDTCSFYISEIRTTDTSVTVCIAGEVEGQFVASTPVATFPITGDLGSVASATIPFGAYTIYTKIVAGDLSAAGDMPVNVELTEDTGRVFVGCVRGITGVGSGSFVVNGVQLSDQLTLNAGQGIDFEVQNFEATATFDVTITKS